MNQSADYLTVGQAAEIARVDVETLRKWLRAGRLEGRKFGREWRTTRQWLEEFGQRAAPVAKPVPSELRRRADSAAARMEAKYGIKRRTP